jgi:hypothetical protein
MLIQVNYPDNRFDYVKDNVLHNLIESRTISRFRRSSGWVTVGLDPVRQFQRISAIKPVNETKNLVRVAYDDKHYDYITDTTLDNLIETKKISKLKRVTGWITVGVDPIRKSKRDHTFKFPNELKRRAI